VFPRILKSNLLIWLLCAGALILACGPFARHTDSSASAADVNGAPPATPVSDDSAIASSLAISVHDGVALSLHITNVADHSLEVNFPNGQTHDFVVLDSLGREVWRWSKGRMFTQSLRNKLLDARETVTYDEKWSGPAKPGHYTVIGILESSNHPVKEQAQLSLP